MYGIKDELRIRYESALNTLRIVDEQYNKAEIDGKRAIASYANVLSIFKDIAYSLGFEYTNGAIKLPENPDNILLNTIAMIGVLYTRIGDLHQKEMDFEKSFEYLLEGYRLLNYLMLLGNNFAANQLNWNAGLIAPIRNDDYDPNNPKTWRFSEPRDEYWLKIAYQYYLRKEYIVSRLTEAAKSMYRQTLDGMYINDSVGGYIQAQPMAIVLDLIEEAISIFNESENFIDKVDGLRINPNLRDLAERIIALYNSMLATIRSCVELVKPDFGKIPEDLKSELEEFIPEDD